jgi:hypothetical protein
MCPRFMTRLGLILSGWNMGCGFRGPGLFQGQTGAVQQGDSEKSGTKFRPEANSFQTKKKLLSVQFSRVAGGCTSFAIMSLNLSC